MFELIPISKFEWGWLVAPGSALLHPQKSLSFTPGFSLVLVQAITQKPFQRFPAGKNGKPLKRFSALVLRLVTRLKPGVNDRDF
jgi:hypothetical protein